MMQLYIFVLGALFVPFAQGYVADKPYPTLAHCNQNVISSIKTYWRISGTPQNVLQRVERSGLFTFYHTSYNYFNSDNKCIYIRVIDGLLNMTFVPKDGNTTAHLMYNVEQGEDGVIKGKRAENDAPEYRWNWYSVYFGNGVAVCYVCSDYEGSREEPLVTIMVANKHKNLLTSSFVNTGSNLLKGWGLNFKYSYGQECNLKE